MNYVFTWIAIVLVSIGLDGLGGIDSETAAVVMIASFVSLFVHWLFESAENSGHPADRVPFPDLRDKFLRHFFLASATAKFDDWRKAAYAAKQWENAMSKPARHTNLRNLKRKSA